MSVSNSERQNRALAHVWSPDRHPFVNTLPTHITPATMTRVLREAFTEGRLGVNIVRDEVLTPGKLEGQVLATTTTPRLKVEFTLPPQQGESERQTILYYQADLTQQELGSQDMRRLQYGLLPLTENGDPNNPSGLAKAVLAEATKIGVVSNNTRSHSENLPVMAVPSAASAAHTQISPETVEQHDPFAPERQALAQVVVDSTQVDLALAITDRVHEAILQRLPPDKLPKTLEEWKDAYAQYVQMMYGLRIEIETKEGQIEEIKADQARHKAKAGVYTAINQAMRGGRVGGWLAPQSVQSRLDLVVGSGVLQVADELITPNVVNRLPELQNALNTLQDLATQKAASKTLARIKQEEAQAQALHDQQLRLEAERTKKARNRTEEIDLSVTKWREQGRMATSQIVGGIRSWVVSAFDTTVDKITDPTTGLPVKILNLLKNPVVIFGGAGMSGGVALAVSTAPTLLEGISSLTFVPAEWKLYAVVIYGVGLIGGGAGFGGAIPIYLRNRNQHPHP